MINSCCADFQHAGTDGNDGHASLVTERADPAPIYNFFMLGFGWGAGR